MSRGSDPAGQRLWSDPALAELVERETAAVLWSLDGSRVVGASVGTAGLAPALRAAGGENLRGRLRRVAAALSAGSGVRLERVTLPQGYGVGRLLLECHRVATQDGEFLLTILRGPLPRLPRVVDPAGDDAPSVPVAGETAPAARRSRRAGAERAQPDPHPLERLFAFAGERPTIRFIWESDADGALTRVSGELAALVGDDAGQIEGRPWRVLVEEGIVADPGGQVMTALAQQATWSGKEVLWRIGADASAPRLPVELAGIPVHDGRRRFQGYRGFGLARVERLRGAGAAGPDREVPSRQEEPQRGSLSENEKQAFRDIARALGVKIVDRASPGPDPAIAMPGGEEAAPERVPRRLRLVQTDEPPEALLPDAPSGHDAPVRPAAFFRNDGAGVFPVADDPAPEMMQPAPPVPEERPETWQPGEAAAFTPGIESDGFATQEPAELAEDLPFPADDGYAVPAVWQSAPEAGPPVPAGRAGDEADASIVLIANRLPIGMLVSRDGEVLFANRALLDLLGYDDAAAFRRAGGLRALFMGAPGGGEAPLALRTAHGTPLSVDARMAAVPWRDPASGQERPATLMSFRRAIEPRTEAHLRTLERELRYQEARVRALDTILDTATDGVVTLDGLGRLLSVNRSAEALFGCEETDVVGGSFWHLLAPQSRATAAAYFEGLRAGGLASVLNDGLAVSARAPAGSPASEEIPLMMVMGRLAPEPGEARAGAARPGATGGHAGRTQRFFAILRDASAAPGGRLAGGVAAGHRESADQAQFLARVSHEIRTPLNAIIGFAEIMLEERFGPVGTDRYREYLRDIHASGGQVITLVNDLLDLARIEAGRLELAPAEVSLNDVVAGCVGLMMPQAERQQVVLRTGLLPGLASVNIDERALQQIVLNLLSNAVKFTDAGGQVIVSTARADDGCATLRIRDTGVGMTRSQVSAALTPFAQLNTTHLGRPDGAGLGLPLTRALVEASGGRFAITSTPMEGTLVEIVFPRSVPSGPAQERVRPSSQ